MNGKASNCVNIYIARQPDVILNEVIERNSSKGKVTAFNWECGDMVISTPTDRTAHCSPAISWIANRAVTYPENKWNADICCLRFRLVVRSVRIVFFSTFYCLVTRKEFIKCWQRLWNSDQVNTEFAHSSAAFCVITCWASVLSNQLSHKNY